MSVRKSVCKHVCKYEKKNEKENDHIELGPYYVSTIEDAVHLTKFLMQSILFARAVGPCSFTYEECTIGLQSVEYACCDDKHVEYRVEHTASIVREALQKSTEETGAGIVDISVEFGTLSEKHTNARWNKVNSWARKQSPNSSTSSSPTTSSYRGSPPSFHSPNRNANYDLGVNKTSKNKDTPMMKTVSSWASWLTTSLALSTSPMASSPSLKSPQSLPSLASLTSFIGSPVEQSIGTKNKNKKRTKGTTTTTTTKSSNDVLYGKEKELYKFRTLDEALLRKYPEQILERWTWRVYIVNNSVSQNHIISFPGEIQTIITKSMTSTCLTSTAQNVPPHFYSLEEKKNKSSLPVPVIWFPFQTIVRGGALCSGEDDEIKNEGIMEGWTVASHPITISRNVQSQTNNNPFNAQTEHQNPLSSSPQQQNPLSQSPPALKQVNNAFRHGVDVLRDVVQHATHTPSSSIQ